MSPSERKAIQEAEDSDEIEEISFNEKIKYQRRALILKSFTLQVRMLGTNICQMVTPILVLLIVLILKEVSKSNIDFMTEFSLYLPFPYLFHMPYEPMSAMGKVFNITDCEQWYYVEYNENASDVDKEFFGYNDGYPMTFPLSDGILARENLQQFPCKKVGKSTPYFKPYDFPQNKSLNLHIHDVIGLLHEYDEFDFNDKNANIPLKDDLPDGMFKIHNANEKGLNYTFSMNDNRYL